MSENTFNQNIQDGKPVNINISFNISRKQVTQNLNPFDQDRSFNFKSNIIDDSSGTNLKSRNSSYRAPKTPQLAQTDRNMYMQNIDFVQPTEQLKKKKKRKQSSGDYAADKTQGFPFYPNQLQKSLPSHKRGYTTTLARKQNLVTATKSKKSGSKVEDSLKQNRVSSIIQYGKSDSKPVGIQKSLKSMINKIINNQLSKRSLPLPNMVNKSKYNQSASLTSRKINTSRPAKKRSSKSNIATKQKSNSNVSVQHHRQLDKKEKQISQQKNQKFLQKLSNFKSVENSVLISQVDKMQEKQDILQQKAKLNSKKKIVIKTDQSMQCIDEIHNYEKNKFRDQFFNNGDGNKQIRDQLQKTSQTQYLIQTYMKLLNQNNQQIDLQEQMQIQRQQANNNRKQRKRNQIPSNINQKIQICESDQNYLNKSDYLKVQQLLNSQKKQQKMKRNSPIKFIQQIQHQQHQKSLSNNNELDQQQFSQKHQQNTVHKFEPQQNVQKQLLLNFRNEKIQENISQSGKKTPDNPMKAEKDQDPFRPFISSQIQRQASYGKKYASSNQEERIRLNQIKKHEIQKWGYLLQYIKSNINKQSNTQQVLQEVYKYLQQAKIDLLQQQQTSNKQVMKSPFLNGISSNKKQKQRLEQQFTNKLSSQISKSNQLISQEKGIKNQKNKIDDESNQQKQDSQHPSNQSFQQQQNLPQQVQSFKSQYESQQNEDIKYMNLETIESALKNRFRTLNQKKEKELIKLDQNLDQKKISKQEYEERKSNIQKWFKNQTNQILLVKKNIWKGYNEAKTILDKSYINSRFEQQYKVRQKSGQKSRQMEKSSQKKKRGMMKCLSQSYLNKKRLDYKKFIEEQEKKREQQGNDEQEVNRMGLKRQRKNLEDSQSQQKQFNEEQDASDHSVQDYYKRYNPNEQPLSSSQDYNDEDQTEEKDQEEEQQSHQFLSQQIYKEKISTQNKQSNNNQQRINRLQDQNLLENQEKITPQQINTEDQMQKLNQKLQKLKQKHKDTLNRQDKNSKQHQNRSQDKLKQKNMAKDHIQNQFIIEGNQLHSSYQPVHQIDSQNNENLETKQGLHVVVHKKIVNRNSPQSSPLSPTSIHYEQLQKDLHSHSQSQQNQEQKSQDYINEEEQEYPYEQEEQIIINQQLNKKSGKSSTSRQEQIDILEQKNKKLSQLSQPSQPFQLSPQRQPSYEEVDHKGIDFKNKDEDIDYFKNQQQIELQKKIKKDKNANKILCNKFKYLTEQDKEDIFQFLFLDLCIQLYQEPCKDNKIMSSINNYVMKIYELNKRKKGVKTNLNVVKDYLKRFCGYIVRTNKKTLQNLNVPMGPTAIEMLRYMHENDDLQDQPLDDGQNVVTLIVPVSIFDTFQRSLLPTLQFQKYYDNEEKQQERINFLKNILHIHNKALFDALNQFLDQQRPFGIWGKPFPWKKSSSFSHVYNELQLEQKLKKSAQKVVQACSYVCGLLVDKEQSLVGNTKISEGYIQQIRQDRISRMLANDMIQNEDRWVFYDDEETQVLVQSGNFIYNKLLKQCLNELLALKNRQIIVE